MHTDIHKNGNCSQKAVFPHSSTLSSAEVKENWLSFFSVKPIVHRADWLLPGGITKSTPAQKNFATFKNLVSEVANCLNQSHSYDISLGQAATFLGASDFKTVSGKSLTSSCLINMSNPVAKPKCVFSYIT